MKKKVEEEIEVEGGYIEDTQQEVEPLFNHITI